MALFKYTNHYGVNIIRDLQLKVTPPNELNDPFEFSPYMAGIVTEEHIRELFNATPPREIYDIRLREGEKLPPFDEFENHLQVVAPLLVKHGSSEFQKQYEELVAKELESVSKRMGLVCCSKQENDILMWSHYTDSHKGMLIEFDESHEYFKLYSRFKEVKYSKERVPFNPAWPDNSKELESYAEAVLCTKNEAWLYEKEWRSLFPLHWCEKKLIGPQTLYFTNIPPGIIRRVVFGYRCPLDIQNQILELKQTMKLNFSLERAFIHRSEFKVEYKPAT